LSDFRRRWYVKHFFQHCPWWPWRRYLAPVWSWQTSFASFTTDPPAMPLQESS